MKLSLSMLAPHQVRFGIKTGMATAIAYFLTCGLGLEHWQWAVIAALVAMQDTVADAIMAALRHLGGGTPAAPAPDLIRSLIAMVDRTERRLGELRDNGTTNRLNLHEIVQFFTFFHALRGMAADLLLALDKIQHPRQG